MELWHIIYNRKQALFLYLGRDGEKVYGIKTDHINKFYANVLRKNVAILKVMDGKRRLQWIKAHCPSVMSGFRTLIAAKVTTVAKHALKEL